MTQRARRCYGWPRSPLNLQRESPWNGHAIAISSAILLVSIKPVPLLKGNEGSGDCALSAYVQLWYLCYRKQHRYRDDSGHISRIRRIQVFLLDNSCLLFEESDNNSHQLAKALQYVWRFHRTHFLKYKQGCSRSKSYCDKNRIKVKHNFPAPCDDVDKLVFTTEKNDDKINLIQ